MADGGCWVNFPTRVEHWEVSTLCWRKSKGQIRLIGNQAAADSVLCVSMRIMRITLCCRTTIQHAERPGLCASPSATHALTLGYCAKNGHDWANICRPWGGGELPVLGYCDVLLSQQMLPAINMSQATRLYFNKTALQHIAPTLPSSCCSGGHRTSSVLTSGCQTVQIWTPPTTRSGESCSSEYINVV